MGNCICRGSKSMIWAGDEWDSKEDEDDQQQLFDDRQRVLSHLNASSCRSSLKLSRSSGSNGSSTEVKIKITKKELEELLGKAKLQNMSSEQVLAGLLDASSGRYSVHQHDHWRPGLTSIPEV